MASSSIKRTLFRNTPTGVGKIVICHFLLPFRGKHPHGCGEDKQIWNGRLAKLETPPRVWGRSHRDNSRHKTAGNTPTGVGKICRWALRSATSKKHPHGCGEDKQIWNRRLAKLETPPRVWGRYTLVLLPQPRVRNTPTGVGKIGNQIFG